MSRPDLHEMVRQFHDVYSSFTGDFPAFPPAEIVDLRLSLIAEELSELRDAVAAGDVCEVADALGDLLYVVAGAGLAFGLPLREVVEEIHRSNLSKLGKDGKPIYREDGKVLKGPNFTPPDLARMLAEVMPGGEA
jgi:predicted HAD superfamily Cof-like phosphohydrolase